MSSRVGITLTDKTFEELEALSKRYEISLSSLGAMCLRAGLDVINLALSEEYKPMMELLSGEYDVIEEMKREKKTPGVAPDREISGENT